MLSCSFAKREPESAKLERGSIELNKVDNGNGDSAEKRTQLS